MTGVVRATNMFVQFEGRAEVESETVWGRGWTFMCGALKSYWCLTLRGFVS